MQVLEAPNHTTTIFYIYIASKLKEKIERDIIAKYIQLFSTLSILRVVC